MNFLSIVKLTIKNARKSNVFVLLATILLFTVFTLPNVISGDGTVLGYLKITINYNITAIVTILSLSSIWLSCFVMTDDVEHYQIHLIVTKPISRTKLWLGKFTGVFLVHFILLLFAFTTTYLFIKYQFNNESNYFRENTVVKKDKTDKEKRNIKEKFFTARRTFYPKSINFNEEIKKRMDKIKADKNANYANKTKSEKKDVLEKIQKDIFTEQSEVTFTKNKKWSFKNLPKDKNIIYFKYRPYLVKVDTEDQRNTRAVFSINTNQAKYPLKDIKTGEFHIIPISNLAIQKDGSLDIGYQNFDPEKKAIFFTPRDGPKLLIKHTSFFDNYIRAGLVYSILLFALIGASCAIASYLHISTAVFVASFYLIFSFFFSPSGDSALLAVTAGEEIINILQTMIQFVTIPIKYFDITSLLSNGELIEFEYIGWLSLKIIVFRCIPIFFVGIWAYSKRELGLVIRK